MDFWDDPLGNIGDAITSPTGFVPFINTALATIAGLAQKSPTPAYSQSQEYLDKVMAQNQANADREFALAQQKLAMGDGGASGAALAAAKLGARVNLKALQDKALADRIAGRLATFQGNQQINNQNQQMLLQQINN